MIRAIAFGVLISIGVVLCVASSVVDRVKSVIKDLSRTSISAMRRNTNSRLNSDLLICNINASSLVASKLTGVVIGAGISGFFLVIVQTAGTNISSGMIIVIPSITMICGFMYPEYKIRQLSKARRRSFLHSFSSFLDLTNILLAGGSGTETALIAAAESGDGWSFDQIRRVLTIAQSTRTSPWTELSRLGDTYALPQIKEIAGSIQLAGEHGARIRTSLAARAESLRYRQMSEVEASANAATERMGLPMVLLFIAFIVLIGYPAVTLVIGGL
jgi:Flp pilus assembly protein TadB